jgi:hypothetical protein
MKIYKAKNCLPRFKSFPFAKFFSTSGISNSNLITMKKLKNYRNNTLNVDMKGSDLIFQTIWSDFVHFSLFERNHINKNFNCEFDYSKYDEESYTIFQDESIFTDYEESSEKNSSMINFTSTENEMKITNTNEGKGDFTLITRIPQEFNLNLKTDRNIKIVNTGDSKLLADKQISIKFYDHHSHEQGDINKSTINSNTNTNTFEAKRIRTTNFNLLTGEENRFVSNIRSYLEAEFINFVSKNISHIRIKKLGVVKEGLFHLKKTNLDIRSIYGPVEKQEKEEKLEEITKRQIRLLTFKIEGGNINLGSVQGNVAFELLNSSESFESNLFIDSLDCDRFHLKSQTDHLNRCEVFVNKVNNSCLFELKKVKNFILFVNVDTKEDFVVSYNNSIIYGSTQDGNKSVIEVKSETRPEILEVSSWDYMKRRIERKRMNKL